MEGSWSLAARKKHAYQGRKAAPAVGPIGAKSGGSNQRKSCKHLLSYNSREQRAVLNAIKFLANQLRVSIVAAGTHEALHVMRYDPQIASRFEQIELPVWTKSQELRRFIAGYLALLPLKKAAAEIDKRFVEYLLELTDGVTGRIIDVLRRAALHGIVDKSRKVGLQQLQYVGAHMPAAIGQRA